MNKIYLLGRLGADPETRHLSETSSVTQANLATSERYTNRDGEKVEETEWHRLVIWNKSGETFAQYMNKGSEVLIEGKIRTRSYDDKDGIKRYATDVIVNSWHFTGGSKTQSDPGPQEHQAPQGYQNRQPESQPTRSEPPQDDSGFDDLPF